MGFDGGRLTAKEHLAAQMVVARLVASATTEQFESSWMGLEWKPGAADAVATLDGVQISAVEFLRGTMEVLWELVVQMARETRMRPADVVSRLGTAVAYLEREP